MSLCTSCGRTKWAPRALLSHHKLLGNLFWIFGLNLERAVSSSERILCSRAPNLGVLCTPDRPPPFVWSLASEVGQAVLSRTKWVIEGCRCRLSSGCSTKSLWCLGIPSGNQQKPSRREVRRELSRSHDVSETAPARDRRIFSTQFG